ncbi:MAG: hypothetical protein Q8P49_04155 [Candidatus Liptonbacteria bacterium]|nr:hypothetical protein [Candidatus Liptonbacteria bacterium]
MWKKISRHEFDRRMEKKEADGEIVLRDLKRGEVIRVLTEPTTYVFEVVDPGGQLVEVTSLHDPDFFETRVCLFCGSIWDNVEIGCWSQAPMKVFGCLLRDCYPVVCLGGRFLVLPKIYEVEIGGRPFFKTTGAPDNLLEN